MISTLTVLLYLGLTLCSRNPVVADLLQKPKIWADPGTTITLNSPVTIWCEGNQDTQTYVLKKDTGPVQWNRQMQKDQINKAKFTITSVTTLDAGRYCCYSYKSAGWSECSDTLELVVTGVYKKPILSALPSPVVSLGGFVTLSCISNQRYNRFILIKNEQFSKSLSSEYLYTGLSPAKFQVGPITLRERWSFRCYGYYTRDLHCWSEGSDILELLVSGSVENITEAKTMSKPKTEILQKPKIWADPGTTITLNSPVTIWCEGNQDKQTYVVKKDTDPVQWNRQMQKDQINKAKFTITFVTTLDAGRYCCYSYNSAGWSEPSDTLELVVTGVYTSKVSLSAQNIPVVTSGGKAILKCVSEQRYNMFILTMGDEKYAGPILSQNSYNRYSWAQFTVGPVTPNKRWIFTCYGCYSDSAQLWSEPSNHLELLVSGYPPETYHLG